MHSGRSSQPYFFISPSLISRVQCIDRCMPHFICFIPCICFQLPLYVLEEIFKNSINATSISIILNIKVHLWICYGILHAISFSIEPLYSHSLFPLIAIVFLVQWGSSEFCATCTSGIVLLWFRILTWDFLIKSSSASIKITGYHAYTLSLNGL